MEQSTNHLLMIEPASFYANPQTMDTNAYQVENRNESKEVTLEKARAEFRAYRDELVSRGVMVTTFLGEEECPDMIFPNSFSTYDDGRMVIYPMLNENRCAEKTPMILKRLKEFYPVFQDWSEYESKGLALEGTASIVSDHVNQVAYAGLSQRTSRQLVEKWAEFSGYEMAMFETKSHAGIPVYHTDFLMYIGTDMAGICAECITDEDFRVAILERLRETHEVVELSMAQLQANCGNALEIVGKDGERMLTFSKSALEALNDKQLSVVRKHYNTIITPDLATIEKYGGGSARCMLMELF